MSTFYERLQTEEKELNERIEKLTLFLNSEKSADLDPLQFNLLCTQESAMKTYGSILSLRLATIKTEQSENDSNLLCLKILRDELIETNGGQGEWCFSSKSEQAIIRAMRKFAELPNESATISQQLKEIWK